jgi:hypothetical protein
MARQAFEPAQECGTAAARRDAVDQCIRARIA